jgi:hypothetical protein
VKDNFNVSPVNNGFFNLYISKLYNVSSETREFSLSNLKVLKAEL